MSKESKRMKFLVYQNEPFMSTSIEELDLSVRSYNCLKRAGFSTIGDIVNSIETQDDLLKYRNLGANSAKEIMRKIFIFHYRGLRDDQIERYHRKVAELNEKDTFEECLPLLL